MRRALTLRFDRPKKVGKKTEANECSCHTALRAEVKCYPTASITNTDVLPGLATDRHTFSTKARLRPKHTAGAALTSQAVADGNANTPFGGCCGELSATAGCFV